MKMNLNYFLILFFILFLSCKPNEKGKARIIEDNSNFSDKENDRYKKVDFDKIVLFWDCKTGEIAKDSNDLKDRDIIYSLAGYITNTDIVCEHVCSKRNSLKKGDVAYLYLSQKGIIFNFECLEIQFDTYDQDCKYPCFLLDYIENNRLIVRQKVERYLNTKYSIPLRSTH